VPPPPIWNPLRPAEDHPADDVGSYAAREAFSRTEDGYERLLNDPAMSRGAFRAAEMDKLRALDAYIPFAWSRGRSALARVIYCRRWNQALKATEALGREEAGSLHGSRRPYCVVLESDAGDVVVVERCFYHAYSLGGDCGPNASAQAARALATCNLHGQTESRSRAGRVPPRR
jgi:hypothetical protein